MTDGVWNQMADNLLQDMRQHVRNLQERVVEAGEVLQQSQSVNEKIVVMKEARFLDTCKDINRFQKLFRWFIERISYKFCI